MNIVGDVAGQLKALEALVEKMPAGELICLGDPNDRGDDSKGVIEYLMKNGKLIQSNHAHILTEAWTQSAMPGATPRYYSKDLVFHNGGIKTLTSYNDKWDTIINFEYKMSRYGNTEITFKEEKFHTLIPKEHIDFLTTSPLFLEIDNYILTHAPIAQNKSIEEACELGFGFALKMSPDPKSDSSVLWNRHECKKPNPKLNGKINIYGHNSSTAVKIFCTQYPSGKKVTNETFQDYLKEFGTGDIWGIAMDTSAANKLSGLHLPTMTIYEQEYI